jgi:hypothetical protein
MDKIIEQLEKYKNSFLAVAGAIYVLGLVNWSIFAYSKSLGIVTVFDTQYFVAGFIPFLLIVLVYISFRSRFAFIFWPIDKTRNWMRKLRRRAKGNKSIFPGLPNVLVSLLYLLAGLGFLGGSNIFNKEPILVLPGGFGVLFIAGGIVLLVLRKKAMLNIKTSFKTRRVLLRVVYRRIYLTMYARLYVFLVATVVLVLYSFLFYPAIPQELGGALPKNCILVYKKGTSTDPSGATTFADTTRSVNVSKPVTILTFESCHGCQ